MKLNGKKSKLISLGCITLLSLTACQSAIEHNEPASKETAKETVSYSTDYQSSIVIMEILENGYVASHGDHSHVETGKIPYFAFILDKLVYQNKDYKLKKEDIQYELEQGYIIKINDKFYYYPKENVKQTCIVTEQQAKGIAKNGHHHHHHHGKKEDNYTFKAKDIVSETDDAFVVRHGDHFHYILKKDLTTEQLAEAKKQTLSVEANTNSTEGITTKTNDGYIFKGEQDIIARTADGLVVKHDDHQHFIYYSQLKGTQWEYLVPSATTNISDTSTTLPPVQTSPSDKYAGVHYETSDHFIFDGTHIAEYLDSGLVVNHEEHSHFIPYYQLKGTRWEYLIPKSQTEQPSQPSVSVTTPQKSKVAPPVATKKTNLKEKIAYVAKEMHIDPSSIKVEGDTLIAPHGDHFHTYKIAELDVTKPLFDKHKHHHHEEVEAPSVEQPQQDGLAEKIAYVAKEMHIDPSSIKVEGDTLIAPHGDHFHTYKIAELDVTKPLFDKHKHHHHEEVEAPSVEQPQQDGLAEKIAYVAQSFNIDPSTIRIEGDTLIYPHGDHFHAIPLSDIDVTQPLVDPHSHQQTGIETLKQLGFDDDIIHDILHAVADTDFPAQESNPENMKAWLQTVRSLNIGQNKDPLKRKGLELMPNIEILGIGFTPIDDITPVYQFKKLKQLYVTKTGITDYSFIKNIPTLEGIDLSQNGVSDISFLQNYPQLKVVAAAGNDITDISALAHLPHLESLNLDYNHIKDISPLASLNELKAVSLEHNQLKNISALSAKPQLDRLFLSNNPGIELLSLKSDALTDLTVNDSHVGDLSFIKNLPNLASLTANNNNIDQLSPLATAQALKHLALNHNNVDTLNILNNSLQHLELANNKLVSLQGVHNLSNLTYLNVDNNIINNLALDNTQSTLAELLVNNNFLNNLEGINQFNALQSLSASKNYISTLHLATPNEILKYLDVSYNNIPQEELAINPETNIPKSVEDNFKAVEGGSINYNYILTRDQVIEGLQQLQEEIEQKIANKQLPQEEGEALKKEAYLAELDIKYSIDMRDQKTQQVHKDLLNIQEKLAATLQDVQNGTLAVEPDNHESHEEGHHTLFDLEHIVSEDDNGFTIDHGDHTHYILKSDLTAEQIEQAHHKLNPDTTEAPAASQADIDAKVNYLSLFYGVPVQEITVDGNQVTYVYNGTTKQENLSDIIVPAMSADLAADFEQELTNFAQSIQQDPQSIGVKDGQFVISHGDHSHYYKISSPGWRLYDPIVSPTVPKLSGDVDDAVINEKIYELENIVKEKFADQPNKMRQLLAWLKDFKENSVPWRMTSTEGYLQTLQSFEETYINENN